VSGYILSIDADFDLDETWEFIAADDIAAADQWIDNFSMRSRLSDRLPAWGTGARI
jgi:hypothetical protein